jgi:hypothetical protein
MLKQTTDQACVWMAAGVLRFWLCDRGFDCDRCPLDAALRRVRRPGLTAQAAAAGSSSESTFPRASEVPGSRGRSDSGL